MSSEIKVNATLYASLKSGITAYYVHKVGREYIYVSTSRISKRTEKVAKNVLKVMDHRTGYLTQLYQSESELRVALETSRLWREVQSIVSSKQVPPKEYELVQTIHALVQKLP